MIRQPPKPTLFPSTTLYGPPAVTFCPFQVNGSCAEQTVESTELVTLGATVKVSVTIESQPAIFVRVAVKVPPAVTFCPFQVNGSCAEQTVESTELVTLGATVSVSVKRE